MKIALVTGANRGIGFEVAKQLCRAGVKVYFGCRSSEHISQITTAMENSNLNYAPVILDVTKTAHIRNFLNHLKSLDEKLDILVNNAGVLLDASGPQDTEEASIFKVNPVIAMKTYEVNTIGPLKLIQSLVPSMDSTKDGRIINVSSGMGSLSEMKGAFPAYRMSKVALNAITRILHEEMKSTAICVNSVCPGWVRTSMGGGDADLSASDAAQAIVKLALMENSPRGKFLRDGKEISW